MSNNNWGLRPDDRWLWRYMKLDPTIYSELIKITTKEEWINWLSKKFPKIPKYVLRFEYWNYELQL